MAEASKTNVRLEIAHVLFIDIVGYSARPTDEQRDLVDQLNQAVRSSDEFSRAAAAGRLKKIPTGDGMALIFQDSPEQPIECAVEISRVLKPHPDLPVRMGNDVRKSTVLRVFLKDVQYAQGGLQRTAEKRLARLTARL